MGDGYLDPSSQEAQSSIAVLVDSFANYTTFSINAKDDAAGLPGLLVGRYLNDNYNGMRAWGICVRSEQYCVGA